MTQVILVDQEDQARGTAEKLASHRAGLLHRAFSVFVYRPGALLLQRRAPGKYHSGGLWANTCCSHQLPGEDTGDAARRRLLEECGISGVPLRELFTFIYRAELANGLVEHELDHVLLGCYDGAFSPDPAEIAELRWVDLDQVEQWLARDPQRLAVWFALAAPRVIREIRALQE